MSKRKKREGVTQPDFTSSVVGERKSGWGVKNKQKEKERISDNKKFVSHGCSSTHLSPCGSADPDCSFSNSFLVFR